MRRLPVVMTYYFLAGFLGLALNATYFGPRALASGALETAQTETKQTGNKAAEDKSPEDKADKDKDSTDTKDADKDAADEDAADKPAPVKEATDKEAADKEATDKPAADKPATDDQETAESGKDKAAKSDQEQAANKKQATDVKSQKSSSDKPSERRKEAEPYQVERKPLKIDVELAGTFVARKMTEVALRPKVWAQFKVLEAVRHGVKVHQGEVLVRFDDTKIEEALATKALDQRLEELALMVAEEEFPRLEKLTDIDLRNTQRAHDQLVAEFERFQQTLRPLSEKIVNFNFQAAKESLAMEQEELDQLRQMYEADDLTEETEKIVLHRQQFAVARAKLYVEYARFNHGVALKVSLPQREEQMATALEQSRLMLARAKMAKSLGLNKARYELEKKRTQRTHNIDQHAKLLGDRTLMELKSPADGVVYYGRCLDGKWPSVSSLRAKLRPFGSVTPGTVLFTIVQPGSLDILSTVSEKNFPQIRAGLAATIVPTGDVELELDGKVAQVEPIPISRGKFRLRIDFDRASAPDWLVADMTCKVKVTTYENKQAILIPQDLVGTDKENKKRKYVLVLDEKEDEPVRRKVKLGHRKGRLVEVVKGLDEGDKLLKPAKQNEENRSSKANGR